MNASSSFPKCLIYLNSKANNGTGLKNWATIESEVKSLLPEKAEAVSYTPTFDITRHLKGTLNQSNEDLLVIAAGGDGTVNFVVNSIMELDGENRKKITLGAIGLGSSNDFQKPFKTAIKGIPCRLNLDNAKLSDIGIVDFQNSNGEQKKKHFIINASLGATAEANRLFNRGDFFINAFKHRMVNLAIKYTAIKKILSCRNKEIQINCDGLQGNFKLTNLNVLKIPYVSGSLYYDQAVKPDDGRFGINLSHGMGVWELIKTLISLEKGVFKNDRHRTSVLTNSLEVDSKDDLVLETDGEIQKARKIKFNINPRALNLLGA